MKIFCLCCSFSKTFAHLIAAHLIQTTLKLHKAPSVASLLFVCAFVCVFMSIELDFVAFNCFQIKLTISIFFSFLFFSLFCCYCNTVVVVDDDDDGDTFAACEYCCCCSPNATLLPVNSVIDAALNNNINNHNHNQHNDNNLTTGNWMKMEL